MTREARIEVLKTLLDGPRFGHCLRVERTARQLAQQYGCEPEKAAVAGLVHDCAKQLKPGERFRIAEQHHIPIDGIERRAPGLLHGAVGAVLAQERLEVRDPEILQAIRCHVTGATNMSTLDKVLYVADYVEPGRRFQGIAEVRGALKRGGLDACILAGLKLTIEDLMHRNLLLHPRSVEAYNAFVGKG